MNQQNSNQRGGRGGSRGRGHGRGPAETELELVRQNDAAEVERKFAKQAEQMLLPDAPPRKRARQTGVNIGASTSAPAAPPPSPPSQRSRCTQWSAVNAGASTSATAAPPPSPPRQRSPCTQQTGVNIGASTSGVNAGASTSGVNVGDSTSGVNEGASTSSSVPSPLMCGWTTGGLRQDALEPAVGYLIGSQSRCSSPSSIAESAYGGGGVTLPSFGQNLLQRAPQADAGACAESSPQPQPQGARSYAGPDPRIVEWLAPQSDSEEEEVALEDGFLDECDSTTAEPAHPHDIDERHDDEDSNRLICQLFDRTNEMTFDWSSNRDSFLGRRENFVGPSGPTFVLNTTDRPLDVFLRFFDDEVFNLIISETNRSGDYVASQIFSENGQFNRMKWTDKSEIAIFLGVLILQGLLPLPVEEDYFKENGYLTLEIFKSLISYSRFNILNRLLYFTEKNATSTVDNDKLRKLGPLLNLLKSKFKGLYLPSRDIAIDESLLEWHGHLTFAQKIARKAAKVGIKTYELCESSTGYCWDFFVYTGKGHTHDGQNTDRLDTARQETDRHEYEPVIATNLTAQIVLDLVRPLLNRGHTLVMDNFYNCPLLARFLKRNKTDCFGTLRLNREFVPEAIKYTSSMLRPGEILQSYCRDISVLLWRDSHIVAMISTIHAGEVGERERDGQYTYKPQVILDYNVAMGAVYRKEQLLSAHSMERQRKQAWYKKFFRRILNVTILNSYIIYKTQHPRTSLREFRTSLANDLISTFRRPQVERPLVDAVEEVCLIQRHSDRRTIVTGNHFVCENPTRNEWCKYCKKARTKYMCKQCNETLCLDVCFEKYHTAP